ncbi:MAG: MFS transporter [Planctomycetia bacterium]|nr:MFS transporter [Planctomycetia bacterium]
MFSLLKPASPAPPLPEDKVPGAFFGYRLRVFAGIFLGYVAYYLLRKNFTLAGPYLTELGFSKTELGFAMAGVALAYGISKFVMGAVSDRSNARNFLTLGLVITAFLTILAGVFASPSVLQSVWASHGITIGGKTIKMILLIWFVIQLLIGWFGGCGWPPCARVLTHWFSPSERGRTFALWNCAHNIGGGSIAPLAALGVAIFTAAHWEYGVFYLPATLALVLAFIVWLLIRDTPQSCGLPPVEVFRKDFPPEYSEKSEQELTAREMIFRFVLNNRILWCVGVANAFVYLIRYGVLDWAPTYLSEVKGYDIHEYGAAYFLFEFAAIPGTLLCGWLSDKLFRGRHALTTILFMALTLFFVLLYWLNPTGSKLIDMIALVAIGFLIYGPVMLTGGVLPIEFVPKKAAGTAAGFMGFWGYFIGTAFFAQCLMGIIVDNAGWNGGFIFLTSGCLVCIFFLILAAVGEEKMRRNTKKVEEKE